MNYLIKTTAMAVMLTVSALSANAATANPSEANSRCMFRPMSAKTIQLIALQNGFTLHKYEDGKMAVENPFGRPVLMKEGQVLTTADGATIRMVGNEVARLSIEIRSVNHR